MAYKDWDRNLRKRRLVRGLCITTWFPPSLLWHSRQGQHNASFWNHGRSSWGSFWGHASLRFGWLQHHLNALHVMAVLVRWGVPRPWALTVSRCWEHLSRGWLYGCPCSELSPSQLRLRDP